MTSKSLKWTAALLALGLGAGTVSAAEPSQSAQQPTQQELMQQLNELKAKVAAMENNQASALAKYDSRDVDATVAAVLKDADRHSLLIDGGVMTGGWDKSKMGFFLGSEDGSSYFHPGIVWWYRGVANYRQGASKDSTTTGFENSLLKPYLDGTLFTKDFAYKFQWTFNKADGTVVLDDAYAAYVFAHNSILGGDLAVKAGQYKPQVVHEQYLGDQFQLAADRSLANFLIGGGDIGPRVQGVSLLLTGNDTPLHAEILVDDGDRSVNTDFQDARPAPVPVAPPPGAGTIAADAVYWGAGGRVDYKFFGDWKDFGDFTSHNAKKDVLIVGAGIHASQQTNSTTLHYTVDAQWKMAQHLSLFGAVYGRHLETRNTLIGGRDDIGGMAQIGYELTRSLEVFGRYSLVALDSDFVAAGAARQIHEITGGVNWYMGPDGSWGHHAKITLDVTYLPNGSPVNAGSTDILSNGGKKDEVVFRGQLQLWI